MKSGLVIVAALAMTGCAEWGMLTDKSLVPEGTEERVRATTSAKPATPEQIARFGILAQLPGRTMRGKPIAESSELTGDMQRWEWTDNGKAISIRHALEDGSYGGETIVKEDPDTGDLGFVYVTNAGFTTTGTFKLADDGRSWTATEIVSGDSNVLEVESMGHLNTDGTLRTSSRYRTDEGWQDGHGFIYYETFDPLPKLKTDVSAGE